MRRLDQVLITNREFNDVIVWNERIYGKKSGKSLRKLTDDDLKNVRKPTTRGQGAPSTQS